MKGQTKSAHLLVNSITSLSSITSCWVFLILTAYLSVNIMLRRTYPFALLLLLYILCNLLNEYFFWKEWSKRVSKNLKTKDWSISLQYHVNFLFGIFWIVSDVLCEVLLIKKALDIKASVIWAFLILIGSKTLGSFLLSVSCRIIGRKNTIIGLFTVVSSIILMLVLGKELLSLPWIFSLIVIKGLFGNLLTVSKTVIADHIEIKH